MRLVTRNSAFNVVRREAVQTNASFVNNRRLYILLFCNTLKPSLEQKWPRIPILRINSQYFWSWKRKHYYFELLNTYIQQCQITVFYQKKRQKNSNCTDYQKYVDDTISSLLFRKYLIIIQVKNDRKTKTTHLIKTLKSTEIK